MALPISYPFKTRVLNSTTVTSNSQSSVAVPGRAKLIGAFLATITTAAQSATGTADITVNGSTAAGMTGIAVTTSTGNVGTNLGAPTANVFLNAGDILATVTSSCVGHTTSYVLREF